MWESVCVRDIILCKCVWESVCLSVSVRERERVRGGKHSGRLEDYESSSCLRCNGDQFCEYETNVNFLEMWSIHLYVN